MADDKKPDVADVATQVQELLDSWNPAPEDRGMDRLIGVPREEGMVQATNSPDDPLLQHDRNPGRDDIDAQRLGAFTDDGPDSEDYSGDEWTKSALKEEIEKRNAAMDDEDNHMSVSGNKDELRQRLAEDDANRNVESES